MKKIFFLLLTFTFSLFAEENKTERLLDLMEEEKIKFFQHLTKFKEHDWTLMVVEEAGKDHLMVVDNASKKILFNFTPELSNEDFRRLQVEYLEKNYYPIILSFWSHGSHGEKLLVIQSENKKFQTKEFVSIWGVDVQVHDADLDIFVKEDEETAKNPSSVKKTWRPSIL